MTTFKFIFKVTYPFRFYWLITCFVALLSAIDIALRPYLMKLITNTLADTQTYSLQHLWHLSFYLIVLYFGMSLVWRLNGWAMLKYKPRMRNYIAKTAFEYVSLHDYNFFQNRLAGSLSAKIGDLSGTVTRVLETINYPYLSTALSVLVAIFALWQINILFAIGIIIWTMIIMVISIVRLKKSIYLNNKVAESVSRILGNIVDCFSNILNMRLFASRNYEIKKLEALQKDFLDNDLKRLWFTFKINFLQGMSLCAYQSLSLIILVYLYSLHRVTAGDFVFILVINNTILEHLWNVMKEMPSFNADFGTIDQAIKTLYMPLHNQDKPDAKKLKVSKGEIIFKNVEFHYKDLPSLFNKKSIVIKAGQKVGLVGYSGGGKSTFINLILRLYNVNSGSIEIDGQDISNVTHESLCSAITMIPQDPTLFHRSISDNIRYGKINASEDEIIEAAKKSNSHGFIMQLPQDYNSTVGERGVKLSGGQRQRIAIARAILKNSPILILDEATSQLDSITEKDIQESLWHLMQGKTTIVIAHRLSTLLNMDRILVFDKGKIVEDGTHKQLIQKQGLYNKLWQSQIGGFLRDNEDED